MVVAVEKIIEARDHPQQQHHADKSLGCGMIGMNA